MKNHLCFLFYKMYTNKFAEASLVFYNIIFEITKKPVYHMQITEVSFAFLTSPVCADIESSAQANLLKFLLPF